MTTCDLVLSCTVEGAGLGPAERAHLAECPRCGSLVGLPALLGRAVAGAAEPAPGFAARTLAGAHGRRRARGRRRIAVAVAGFGLVAGLALVLGLRGRPPDARPERSQPRAAGGPPPAPSDDRELARELVALADVEGSLAQSADWRQIEAPLAPLAPLMEEDLR